MNAKHTTVLDFAVSLCIYGSRQCTTGMMQLIDNVVLYNHYVHEHNNDLLPSYAPSGRPNVRMRIYNLVSNEF